MDWNDDDDSRYMDFGPQQTPEELEAERWDKLETYTNQKNVWTWWETHFAHEGVEFDIMDFGAPGITLAQRVASEPDPIQYFDRLIGIHMQQERAMLEFLEAREEYEWCHLVKSTAKKILTGLVTLKHKIKQVHEKEKETPDFVTVRLL